MEIFIPWRTLVYFYQLQKFHKIGIKPNFSKPLHCLYFPQSSNNYKETIILK